MSETTEVKQTAVEAEQTINIDAEFLAKSEPAFDFKEQVLEKFGEVNDTTIGLYKKMTGKVYLAPLADLSYPLNIEEMRRGSEKIARYANAGNAIIPKSSRGFFEIAYTQKEQPYLEDLLGLNKGNLNKSIGNTYWSQQGHIKMENAPSTLHLENPQDYIKFCVFLHHKSVANSIEEAQKGMWPDAEFVMSSAASEKDAKASLYKAKSEAFSKASKMTDAQRRKASYLLGSNVEGMTDEDVANELHQLIDESPQTFLDIFNLPNRDELELVHRSILKGNLMSSEMGIYFGEHLLGMNREMAAATLAKEQMQPIKIQLMSLLK